MKADVNMPQKEAIEKFDNIRKELGQSTVTATLGDDIAYITNDGVQTAHDFKREAIVV